MANAASSSPQRANVSLRKTNKPLMEKRRRARINDSLTQLKSLVIQGTKKDSSQFNKLEKADILELTVKHLRSLQEQQQQVQSSNSTIAGKYQAGFMECANEVIRYIGQSQGFSDDVKSRVVHHLASCLKLSSKQPFIKPAQQPTNQTVVNPPTMQNGLHAISAQLSNGQIIQIVNPQFHNMKNTNSGQFTGSVAPAVATASLPMTSTSNHSNLPVNSTTVHSNLSVSSSPTHIPVIITSDHTNSVSPTEPFHIRYTQPLHIQIPPVLSPVIIQPKPAQLEKQPHYQTLHKIPDAHRILSSAQQETIVTSSTPSPHPTELSTFSPINPSVNQKLHPYYTHDDSYADFIPRSRTYSLASSASTESELTSPLNLSQSPKYYDHKEIIGYSSKADSSHFINSMPDKSSPTHQYSKNYILQSQVSSSNFASVIVDGRKNVDNHTLKYMHLMDEDRICFRHDSLSSPASSVGEERLWRPW